MLVRMQKTLRYPLGEKLSGRVCRLVRLLCCGTGWRQIIDFRAAITALGRGVSLCSAMVVRWTAFCGLKESRHSFAVPGAASCGQGLSGIVIAMFKKSQLQAEGSK